MTHPLKVFLCHASGDKPPVRDLYKRLTVEGMDAWLDQEKLLPGQDWRLEIPKAVHEADVVVICLSKKSITKEGYVQKEIKFALDIAEEKPEGTIFLIPARLEDCIVPERLSRWQWVDLYEENGFAKLLRSLKLRADAVGAAIEPSAYEDTDKERERRIKQLYTEGLAAFYTEDWDKACHRFQSILSEQPNHKNATEKLAEAERQRNLSRLYVQSREAIQAENWQVAIKILDELSQKSANYKDVAQLLGNARKQKQLKGLYAEAKTLYDAQKWEAVLKVFEQISMIEPAYPDPDGLVPSTQKEVAEIKRLSDLNDLYSNAVEEMDAGQWIDARRLLEQVHKSQTGYLETEKLLKKAEEEITREEEKRRQNDQINTLYEQAHGLLRSKKWRNALEKLEQIHKLDEHFPDADGIVEKALRELAREEQEAERQNNLAALYAEAVRLLKEEKYQDALDKWQEVKAVDPKYPDRQWVHRTARRKLTESVKPIQIKPRYIITKSFWVGIASFIAIGAVVIVVALSGRSKQNAISTSTSVAAGNIAIYPTFTMLPFKTITPRPATAIPTTRSYADPMMYDDFGNSGSDGNYDKALWKLGPGSTDIKITKDGELSISGIGAGANLTSVKVINSEFPIFSEARVFLDPDTVDNGSLLYVGLFVGPSASSCQIVGVRSKKQDLICFVSLIRDLVGSEVEVKEISPGWHIVRVEFDPESVKFSYYLDHAYVGSIAIPSDSIPAQTTDFPIGTAVTGLGINNFGPSTAPVGYVDYVRMGAIKDDPIILFNDNFDVSAFDGTFDLDKWELPEPLDLVNGKIYQEGGSLVFTQTERGYPGLITKKNFRFVDNKPIYIETRLKFITDSVDDFLILRIDIDDSIIGCHLHGMSGGWFVGCDVLRGQQVFSQPVEKNQWHIIRVEIDPQATMVHFFVDRELIETYEFGNNLSNSNIRILIQSSLSQSNNLQLTPLFGYFDSVRIGIVEK